MSISLSDVKTAIKTGLPKDEIKALLLEDGFTETEIDKAIVKAALTVFVEVLEAAQNV
jgi:hypothetical protein